MPKGRIRVRLKAYDSRIIDDCCQKILDTAVRTGARVVGPVPLPTDREHYNVARSPFIDRNSRVCPGIFGGCSDEQQGR